MAFIFNENVFYGIYLQLNLGSRVTFP